jgi:acetylornithine/succinyldiaminopimelate/putrescine aminotransferase
MSTSYEFPGFHLATSPVFNGARATAQFSGEYPDTTAVLDLAMVFGCRLWGHESLSDVTALLAAPGAGDLYTSEVRERAVAALCERVASEFAAAIEAGDDDGDGDGDEVEVEVEDGSEVDEITQPDAWRALILHTGSEAVETALKTALRATGRTRMHAFEGAYHGTFGLALAVTHDERFRDPWTAQYAETATWSAWGVAPKLADDTACVIVEPWLGRSGVIPPPAGFHAALREECDRVGALLVLDAVLCGSGRTGATIAECMTDARPDIVCLGKALGGGITTSAVVARTEVASDAWDHGNVEPAHTSTTLGDPAACAAVISSLQMLEQNALQLDVCDTAWRTSLEPLVDELHVDVRGLGLVWSIDTRHAGGGVKLAEQLLDEHRILVVPSGPAGSGITIYPAAITSTGERDRFVHALRDLLGDD